MCKRQRRLKFKVNNSGITNHSVCRFNVAKIKWKIVQHDNFSMSIRDTFAFRCIRIT